MKTSTSEWSALGILAAAMLSVALPMVAQVPTGACCEDSVCSIVYAAGCPDGGSASGGGDSYLAPFTSHRVDPRI